MSRFPARRRMSTSKAFVIATAVAALTPAPVLAQANGPFDIPAQDARAALVTLCLRAGCAVSFASEPGPTFRTRPVRGAPTWQAAMAGMLDGTGLAYRFLDGRTARVWVAPTRPSLTTPTPAPEPTTLSPIIVVGRFADGIDTALNEKRTADAIVDSVSAARIGELPAANLAEALQRIPGVAIEREVGEGQFVSVRGLGPLFQSVTLNGAPVAFNENIRNSTQSGRQFRFRALSADLLAGATLTKSATADLVDGGIGSNIDIRTVRGLGGAPFLSGQAATHHEARSGQTTGEINLSARWRDPDHRFGLVGGVSTEARHVQFDRLQTQRYRDIVLEGRSVAAPNDIRTTLERERRTRTSLFAGAQWRPADTITIDFDALASRFGNAIREDRIVYEFGERLTNGSVVPGSARSNDGVLVAAALTNGRISNNLEVSDQTHDNLASSLALETDVAGWRLQPRLSYSLALSGLSVPLQRIAAISPEGLAYGFVFGPDPMQARRFARLVTTFDLTDPGALTTSRYGVRAIDVRDDDLTLQVSADRFLNLQVAGLTFDSLRIGGQTSGRSRDYQRRDREAALRPGHAVNASFFGHLTPANAFSGVVLDGQRRWTAANFERFRDAYWLPGEHEGVVFSAHDLQPTGTDLQSSYGVSESLTAAYARLDGYGVIAGLSASGNVGVRAVATRTRVAGSILGVDASGALTVRPLTHNVSRMDWLPSANLAIDVGPQTRVRLAASRTMTRPSLADLGAATIPASTLVSAIYERGQAAITHPSPSTIFTGVGGNPDLKPYSAVSFDVSLEHYFKDFGALALAVFHKSVDDYVLVVNQTERLTFATRSGPPVTADVLMSRPRNAGRATINGLEAGFSRRWSTGLGLWASVTVTDATSRASDGAPAADLQGVSRLSYSISPFIERGPVEAHLSWTWRSPFRSIADLQGGGVTAFVVGEAGTLDAAASYRLTSRVTAFVEAANLTDAVDIAYDGVRSRPLQITRSGRAFGLGLRVSL